MPLPPADSVASITSRPGRVRWIPWPKRVDISLLCFFGLFIATCDRVNISVAAPTIMREYGWDTTRMGWVFSAFYLGYVVFMIPSGVLADLWGPKRVFAWGVSCWSIFTAVTPVPRSLGQLAVVRSLMGVGESATIPSMGSILARWCPPREYSRTAGFSWSGGYAGSTIAFPLASMILRFWGWRTIFYVFAGLGAVWLLFWWKSAFNRPEDCPSISDTELKDIVSSRPPIPDNRPIAWALILRARSAWAIFLLHFSSNWFTYFLISWLPTYFLLGRHFSLQSMALGSSLPFLSALFGTNLFGALIDHFSRKHNRTRVSKLFLLAFAAAAAILLLLPHVSSPPITVFLLCLSAVLMTGATPVFASGSLDLVPRSAGSFVGVQNSIANLAGVLAPVLTGYLAAAHGWNAAFACSAAVCWLGITTYLLVGKAERQSK
jgi:MFS family permease